MAVTWYKTKFLGVRFREHKSRKHGGNRPDKCFSIRYKLNGQDKEEVVGWSTQGVTAESAFKLLAQLRENARLGTGPLTLAELRASNEEKSLRERQAQAQNQAEQITFSGFWESDYFPNAQLTKKTGTIASERWLYNKWIAPIIGNIPLQRLSIREVETIVNEARKDKKSAATIRYILAIISQVWHKAEILGVVIGDCPCKKIKKPRQDNRRIRFLTKDEADRLLAELALHSKDMRDIALLSLYTGMRAGEIHALRWVNVNFANETIEIVDTKSKKNRTAFMPPEVKEMLLNRRDDKDNSDLVFPGKKGRQRKEVSDTFDRAVNKLGLNDSGAFTMNDAGEEVPVRITEARQRVVFHTLRHTFASWLVQKGIPLYTVSELLGHSTIDMTRRYSHLAPNTLRAAAMMISGSDENVDGNAA